MIDAFWPGTSILRSTDNAFHWRTGAPSIAKKRTASGLSAGEAASRSRERAESEGVHRIATMKGLSPASDKRSKALAVDPKRLHVYGRGKAISLRGRT